MTVESVFRMDQEFIMKRSAAYNEPSWLLELRLKALEQSHILDLPRIEKTKIDKWEYVPEIKSNQEEEQLALNQLPQELVSLLGEGKEAGNVVIHKNGQAVYRALQEDLRKQGVIFTDIITAIREHGDLVQQYFMNKIASVDQHKLSAVHAALVNCGIFLYVPKHLEVNLPIQSIFWQEAGSGGLAPHILIVAEENSKVTYVENSFGTETVENVNSYVAEVYVGANAQVTFAAVDHLGEKTTSYIYRHALVEQGGQMNWALGQMNNGHTISDNTTTLQGNGACGDTKSVVVGHGEQSINIVQKMIQLGRNTDSQMLSHAVMKDAARSIFNAITKMEKGATKANGEQTQRVLMLDEKARGDANPILLIDEDDVTAGHAASVGKINAAQLFYLMSRGIEKAEAERLIILGFLNPVVENIPLEGVRKRLTEVIERKIK